ncbi:MAG: VCBS repeat-containing protein, partial [Candidatus Eisenbacteria bacterium]|nr:VCBS repeat-containing protein [Candidatus Eisenbacteria bacterium]
IHILVLNIGPAGVGGYFSPTNEYPSSVYPTSNELDMLYYDDNLDPRTSDFGAVVPAHELQHMINWNQDANEVLWINEGCSGLAELLVGYLNAGGWADTWAQNTDASLTNWEPDEGDYFCTALFAIYLYDRFGGPPFTRSLLAEPANGITGIENALQDSGFELDFATLFKNWSLAILIDNPSPDFHGGAYGYSLINLPLAPGLAQDHGTYPVPSTSEQVAVWGIDYLRLRDGALMEWAISGPGDEWRHLDVLHVRYPFCGGSMEVYDRGEVAGTLVVSLDGFGATWDPEVMVVCNTSEVDLTLTYQEFTQDHPDTPSPLAGWPATGLGILASSPVYADGVLGASDRNGRINLLDSAGQPLPGWPVQIQDQLWATPTLADLDGDGSLEVIVGTRGAKLHVFGLDGSERPGWPNSLSGSQYGIPNPVTAVDLDGDGGLEIVAASFSGDLVCLTAGGVSAPGWPVAVGAPLYSSPAAGDLNGDGRPELAVASMDSMLHVFSAEGQELAGWPNSLAGRSWGGAALGVFDGGIAAIVVADETGSVAAFDLAGAALPGWPAVLGERVQAPCALGDLDGDGRAEVVVATLSGMIHVLDGEGVELPGWPRATGAEVWASPVIADLDGDGAQEVAVASEQGKISVYEGAGTCTEGWPLLLGEQLQAGPAVADVDGDLTTDVILPGTQGTMQVWALGLPAGPADDWPQNGRDPAHTSALLRPGAAGPGPTTMPQRLALAVTPVPARYDVMVRIDGAIGPVRLDVYDVRGARVRSLPVDARLEGVIVGPGLGSGTYLLKAQDRRGSSLVVPMILVK